MAPTVKCELRKLWAEKEIKERRRITIGEVARATGRSRDAISGMLSGQNERWDGPLLADVAAFFDVSDGSPLPFLVFYADN